MDINKITELETQISRAIKGDSGHTVSFFYKTDAHERVTVKVFTRNTGNGELFLLSSATATSEEMALGAILEYVTTHKNSMSPFTVLWAKVGTGKTNTSYFYCKNVREVVAKFFDGKEDEDAYVVYEIKLNPIA